MHQKAPSLFAALALIAAAPAQDPPAGGQKTPPETKQAAPVPVDAYGMRMWQLVMIKRGPKYDELKGAERKKAMDGHFANMQRLGKAGKLRLAGPFQVPKDAPADAYAGLFLFDVKTRDEALELCKTDPSVSAGVFTVDVLGWYGPSDIQYRGDPFAKVPRRALFNGVDLRGWHADVPKADGNPDIEPSFVAEKGLLVSRGRPQGHLITDESFRDYRLTVEWRWPGKPGNCGILVHASKPRMLYKMFPQSIECQLFHGNAGDFWCIGEDIKVPDMVARRGPEDRWGVVEGKARRIKNLTDDSEKPLGEWNSMVIECRGNRIDVWVNGDKVNDGFDCTTDHGQIAIQAEGAECHFRRVELSPLPPLPK